MLTERELQINPIVQESVVHNTKVRNYFINIIISSYHHQGAMQLSLPWPQSLIAIHQPLPRPPSYNISASMLCFTHHILLLTLDTTRSSLHFAILRPHYSVSVLASSGWNPTRASSSTSSSRFLQLLSSMRSECNLR